MYDTLFFVGLIAGWIILNVWILPLFGIQTCMSGACRVPRVERAEPRNTTHKSSTKAKQLVKENAHEPSESSRP